MMANDEVAAIISDQLFKRFGFAPDMIAKADRTGDLELVNHWISIRRLRGSFGTESRTDGDFVTSRRQSLAHGLRRMRHSIFQWRISLGENEAATHALSGFEE